MDKTILFHCSEPVLDENGELVVKANGKVAKGTPTHTLGFKRLNADYLIVGWAVAHSELDMYSKSEGRKIVDTRIDAVTYDIANGRTVIEAEGIGPEILPHRVTSANFDFYLSKAVDLLYTEDEKNDGVTVAFRGTTNTFGTDIDTYIVELDFSDVVDDELEEEKVNGALTDYIFASYTNDNGVVVYIQDALAFKANGYSTDINDDMGAVIVPMMNDHDFLLAIDEQTPIIVQEELEEIEVVRLLKAQGLGFSTELQEFVDNELED